MKIGILTFHCAYNYGAVLQAYALQEFLKSKGYSVEIINYRPKYLLTGYRLFHRIKWRGVIGFVKDVIKELIIFPKRFRCWLGFFCFERKYFNLSKPISEKSSIPSSYDVYVVGSDQIWNPYLTHGFDPVYFCDFSFRKDGKFYISYAPSIGITSLNEEERSFFRKQLQNFDIISVREQNARELLTPLVDKPLRCVLDPTLMTPQHVWNKMLTNTFKSEGKYVLVYQAIPNKETLSIAYHIAKQLSAKVIPIACVASFYSRKESQLESPEGFINAIRNATCVVTNSFHGTAFSIIMNRPFYTTMHEENGLNERSRSLLNLLGLQHRMIALNDLPTFSMIDYSKVNSLLDDLRMESQDFLASSLVDYLA